MFKYTKYSDQTKKHAIIMVTINYVRQPYFVLTERMTLPKGTVIFALTGESNKMHHGSQLLWWFSAALVVLYCLKEGNAVWRGGMQFGENLCYYMVCNSDDEPLVSARDSRSLCGCKRLIKICCGMSAVRQSH